MVKTMRNKRNTAGFTMAELLIVVAIITVLSGVGFVAVQNYQRDMALLERDAIAKEIFVAAQNHLTMADGQGYMGVDAENIASLGDGTHLVLYNGDDTDAEEGEMLVVMLPFGAIDETVRGNGRYYIHYQTNPGRVLDVFYWTPSGQFGGSNGDGFSTLYDNRQNRDWRKGHNPIIGWYGGEGIIESGGTIEMPSIEVENAERLLVRITNPNKDNPAAELKLIIKGATSGAMKAITVLKANIDSRIKDPDATGNVYTIVLDDITDADLRFAQLGADTGEFLPGEDITVQAVSFSNSELTNIAYSAEVTTNSLFADIESGAAENAYTAMVGNMRHLENLDDGISKVAYNDEKLKITAAKQIADLSAPAEGDDAAKDLSWTGFVSAIKAAKELSDDSHIKVYDAEKTGTTDDCFRPVSPTYALAYDGQNHSVSGIAVNNEGDAGLFGALKSGSGVSNLELIDFSITTTSGNAGALAGTLTDTTVTNVLARNTGSGLEATVTGSGSVGGLIGSMSGGTVDKSAAALVVSGGDAGGLIGKASGGATITASYAGGHTKDATYYDGETPIYNVTGTGSAGGLIGDAGDATITGSYATASATGATAGGLVGKSGGSIDNCYATGLVEGTTAKGAFAGELTGSAANCLYYEIINEGMPATGNTPAGGSTPGVTALDKDMTSYNAFVQTGTDPASPYDGTLANLYGEGSYSLKTVGQLGAKDPEDTEENPTVFVATHYGDWPAPEQLVINK